MSTDESDTKRARNLQAWLGAYLKSQYEQGVTDTVAALYAIGFAAFERAGQTIIARASNAGLEFGHRTAMTVTQLNRDAKAERISREIVDRFRFLLGMSCIWLFGASLLVGDGSWAMSFFRLIDATLGCIAVADLFELTKFRPFDYLQTYVAKMIRALQRWVA